MSDLDLLYHYTTQEGLKGIIESRWVWATVVHFLNDGREWRYALEIAHEAVRSTPGWESDTPLGLFLADCDMWLENARDVLVCVASFTAAGDLLSQWRGYCEPGNGFSLGLPREYIERAASPPWTFRRCIYERRKQESLVSEYLGDCVTRSSREAEAAPPEELVREERRLLRSRAWECAINFTRLGPALKHPAFSEEQEWRAISRPMKFNELRTRPGPNSLVPYTALDITNPAGGIDPVRVVVGPTVQPELSKTGVVALMFANNVKYDLISESQVPYRPW